MAKNRIRRGKEKLEHQHNMILICYSYKQADNVTKVNKVEVFVINDKKTGNSRCIVDRSSTKNIVNKTGQLINICTN